MELILFSILRSISHYIYFFHNGETEGNIISYQGSIKGVRRFTPGCIPYTPRPEHGDLPRVVFHTPYSIHPEAAARLMVYGIL